jgi:transposase InsO family protein
MRDSPERTTGIPSDRDAARAAGSKRFAAALAGAHADDLGHGRDEDLAIADLAGACRGEDGVLCQNWICAKRRDIERFPSLSTCLETARTAGFGTPMVVRYPVLFAIDIASRKVEILGAAVNPGGAWIEQMARNLVDVFDGFLVGKRYVLTDRDPLYTNEFREILRQSGVTVIRLPAKSPNLNAFAERFVLSVRTECLDRIVPLGEAHLRRAIAEFVRH